MQTALAIGLAVVIIGSIATASVAKPATHETRKLESAYVYAQDCYVAYTYGGLTAKARNAFQASQTVGHMLGKSDARIAEDLASADAMTRGDFSRDATSHARLQKECAEVGL